MVGLFSLARGWKSWAEPKQCADHLEYSDSSHCVSRTAGLLMRFGCSEMSDPAFSVPTLCRSLAQRIGYGPHNTVAAVGRAGNCIHI